MFRKAQQQTSQGHRVLGSRRAGITIEDQSEKIENFLNSFQFWLSNIYIFEFLLCPLSGAIQSQERPVSIIPTPKLMILERIMQIGGNL